MKNNILIFTPKFEKDAKQNLEDFFSFAEKLPPLNQKMDYASEYWKGAVNFTKMGVPSRNRDPVNLLDESIRPFFKAYLLYSQTLNPTVAFNEMRAIRSLEKVMIRVNNKVGIISINSAILDQAAQEARESYAPKAAYHAGSHLEKLQKFLVNKKIIRPFSWLNPVKRPEDTGEKVGKKGTENRNKKLPDEDALLTIAEIFSYGEEQLSARDIFTTSAITLLLAAPARGSELFYLKADCLHEDMDKQGNKALGIKWYSGKGYGYEVEWIPSAMESAVREAVRRLKNLSESSRQFAKLLEQQSGSEDGGKNNSAHLYVEYKTGNNVQVKWSEGLFSFFWCQLSARLQTNTKKLWMPNITTLNEDLAPTKKKKKAQMNFQI